MGCSSNVMKCLLNIMNVFLAIFGIALIGVATLVIETAPPVYVGYLYIIGGVNFIAALLGCFGICREHVGMTTAYAIIIFVSLISQVIGHIYSADSEAIKKFAADDVKKTWLEEIQHPGAMNRTQQTFHCCGKNGPNDYLTISRHAYPTSCYPHMIVNQTALYTDGCIWAAEENFTKVFNYSSSGEWGNLIFTAVMFIFALYLVVRFRRKQRRYNY